MSDLASGSHANLILAPGDVYRVGTGGTATVQGLYGAPSTTTTLNASTQDFGPFAAPAKLKLTAVSGAASYSLRSAAASSGSTASVDPASLGYSAVGGVLAIPFSGQTVVSQLAVAGPLAVSPQASAEIGGTCALRLIANGVNVPTFSGMKEMSGSSPYVNSAGQVNSVLCFFDGYTYWYSIATAVGGLVVDSSVPTLSSAAVANSDPTKIVLTYSEALDTGSVPAAGAFAASGGKTVSGVAVAGSAVTVTVSPAYASGDAITVSYTPGAAPVRDFGGNAAVALVAQVVTNQIAGALTPVALSLTSRSATLIDDAADLRGLTGAAAYSARGLFSYYLPAATDGWIELARPVSGNAQSAFIGFDTLSTITAFSDIDYYAQAGTDGSVVHGASTATPTDTNYDLPTGANARMRLRRSGATMQVETTTDGTTWTARQTWTSVTTAALYAYVFTQADRWVYGLKGAGMAQWAPSEAYLINRTATLLDEGTVARTYKGQTGAAAFAPAGQIAGVLAASVDGWIELARPVAANQSALYGFDTNGTIGAYSALEFQASVTTDGSMSWGENAGVTTDTGADLTAGGAAGEMTRLRRVGSTLTFESSVNSGTSWTVRHTYTTTSTAALYAYVYTVADRNIYGLRTSGVAA